jgi:CYTH domain-containing protein
LAQEIERKYLVRSESWRRSVASSHVFRQGYLSTVKERTVRVREVDGAGLLTIKGITVGTTRREFEYPIPVEDATTMLDELCERPLIEKTRHLLSHAEHTWEIDEFAGVNAGLVVAEVELNDAGEAVDLPDWVGEEVSHDPRYFNANLIAHPYTEW